MDNKVTFKALQVIGVEFKTSSYKKDVTNTLENKFKYRVVYYTNDPKKYAITYNLELLNEKFNLSIEAVAHFVTEKPIDDNFKSSNFTKVNSPAISFPYLRVFVSNFILNAGFEPVILPAFNFVQIHEMHEKSKKLAPSKKIAIKRKPKS